ncbi:hypothetical protein AALP_AA3G320700 [Arabis alpina]|uniref:TF-B3 domain-containing protein n=1 Tax=Arabis alpina TaxID=50452 RepID=A0A087HD27_ARAAL|nr:hypothetical protein AALP_AA3G320700 [Arabis alpina]
MALLLLFVNRAIPHDLVKTLSENDLSRKMKIKTEWGRSWKVEISKNPRFYFMEKAGWETFVRENFLGDSELLTFIHKGKMRFTLIIYNKDGKEMLQPRQAAPFLASSSRIKTEDVKKEEVVVSSELSSLDPVTPAAESNGRRKLNFGKMKAEESQSSKRAKTKFRDSAGASSSSATGFTISIKKSYLNFLAIPVSFAKDHMQEGRTMFKIHDSEMKKSWDVAYVKRNTNTVFSAGWIQLVKEYPLRLGNTCKFTVINPTELRLDVLKP